MSEVVQHEGVKVAAPEGWTGDVFVQVVSAIERDEHREGSGRVKVVYPALRVTTYPFPTGSRWEEKGTGVKWRGRTYYVDDVEYRDPHGGRGGFTSDHRTYYTRGIKNESGSPVDYKSPMRERMWDFIAAVRDAYVADHPEWETESMRLRLRWMIEHEDRERASALAEAEKHRVAASKLQAELDAL